MSAPTPAPGDDRPREGYYPDPSIPGYVRYWNGTAWVPGTSRPAPSDGTPLPAPPGASAPSAPAAPAPADPPPATPAASVPASATPAASAPASASTEETGPHFFDEDPPAAAPADAGHGSRPEPASAWGADRSRQSGFGGDQDHRVSWGAPQGADPRVPAEPARPGDDSGRTDGTVTFRRPTADDAPAERPPASDGTFVFRRPTGPARPAAAGTGSAAGPDAAGGSRTPAANAPTAPSAAAASGAPQAGASAPAAGSGAAAAGGERRDSLSPEGTMAFRALSQKVAQERAARVAADPAPPIGPQAAAPAAPRQNGPVLPPQGTRSAQPQQPQQPSAAPVGPMTSGPGGGQPSWAQQVHRLAGAEGGQPVVPWKPVTEDPFQAAARAQAAARPAGLGRRLAARLVDTLVLAAVTGAAAVPLGLRAVDHVDGKIEEARLSGETVTVWLIDGTTGVYLGIVLAVLLLFGVVYEALPTARWGRTLGKKLCGLEVRDIEGHEPPSFGAALRRWLVYSVPGVLVVGVVGVLWCLFDRPWRQCWHDKAAHTFVAG